MVKIKREVKKNLPQLIEWAWDNEIKNERFIHSDSNPPEYVWVNENSEIEFDEDMILRKSDTFTVEVEETVTEDTVIPKMLVIGRFDGYEEVYNRKLNNFTQHLLSAYLIHDDGHMELIYDERKGLVE